MTGKRCGNCRHLDRSSASDIGGLRIARCRHPRGVAHRDDRHSQQLCGSQRLLAVPSTPFVPAGHAARRLPHERQMLGMQTAGAGFSHSDGRFKIADPRRYPLDWVFCSRRCRDIFHALYGRRLAAESAGGAHAIDASEIECAAMRDCLQAFGTAARHIGFDKPLGTYSEAEAMTVIDRHRHALYRRHRPSITNGQHAAAARRVASRSCS